MLKELIYYLQFDHKNKITSFNTKEKELKKAARLKKRPIIVIGICLKIKKITFIF